MRRIATAATLALLCLVDTPARAVLPPMCGDVNNSASVTSSDALLVLKKGVGQEISLQCAGYDTAISSLQSELSVVQKKLDNCRAATCGNDIAESGELCDGADLHGNTCAAQTPSTPFGTLACDAGCIAFDSTGCAGRFDSSGTTILDRQAGLEWEKKDSSDGEPDLANPHDVNNYYLWSATGAAPDGSVFTDFLARLNGSDGNPCYAGHCDWRLPTLEEWQGVPAPAGPDFQPDGASGYWTATTVAETPSKALWFYTPNGGSGSFDKTGGYYARAVRTRP